MEQNKYRRVLPGSLNRDPIYTRLLAHHFGMGVGLGISNETPKPFMGWDSIPVETETCRPEPNSPAKTEPVHVQSAHPSKPQNGCIGPRPYPVLPAVTSIVAGVLVGHGIKCLLEWLRER